VTSAMKSRIFVSLVVTVGIAAAAVSTAGCSVNSQGAPIPVSAPIATSTQSPRATTYSPQVELPFGDYINHMSGLAVDAAGNAYVLDLYYGQVWKQSPGATHITTLPFTGLGRPVEVAVDAEGASMSSMDSRTGF
jgi:DNA-binding beta-propeller fold protein YncE